MRDLAFDIRARDRTQAAFDSATSRARSFGRSVDQSSRGVIDAARATDRLTAATQRYAAATKVAAAANDNFRRRNMQYQLFDVGQMLALGQNPMMTLMQQGPQIAQIYAGQGGVKAALSDTFASLKDLLGGFGRFGPIVAAGAVIAGGALIGMRNEINKTSAVAVSFGDTIKAVFQVAADGVWTLLKPAVDAIAPWFASAWDMVVQGAKAAGNNMVASIMVSIEAIKFGIGAVPDAFVAAGEAAANGFLTAIEQMVREALVAINDLLTDINGMLPEGVRMPLAPAPMSFRLNRVDIGGAAARDRLSASYDEFMKSASGAASRDYMGEFFSAVQQQAVANALARTAEEADKAGKAMKKAAKEAKDPWAELANQAARAAQEVVGFWQGIGKGFINDFKSGIEEGKGLLQSLGDAALNVLDRIATRALEMASDSLISGVLGSLFGGAFISPKAWGVVQSGQMTGLYHSGGIVGQPSMMKMANPAWFIGAPRYHGGGIAGLAPDEVPAILQRGERIIPRNQVANQNHANQNAPVQININVSGARGNSEIREMVHQGVQAGLAQYDAQVLPDRFNQIASDYRLRG